MTAALLFYLNERIGNGRQELWIPISQPSHKTESGDQSGSQIHTTADSTSFWDQYPKKILN